MHKFPFTFLEDKYPHRPLTLEPAPPRIVEKENLTLAWILPPWGRGSGGHTTLFRIIKMMEERGHRNAIFVFDPFDSIADATGARLAEEISSWFIPLDAAVFNGLDSWLGADVAIATYWTTAFALRDLPGCYEKAYMVQDFEPAFYAYSDEYIWAEDTYRFGMRGIAYTPWMAEILEHNYGMHGDWFECGTDLDVYQMHEGAREPETIAVYARGSTERRAVNLSFVALAILKRRRPEIKIVVFGEDSREDQLPFAVEDLGIAAPPELAALYRRASVGMVFSLTTHSLVAQEMMASGLPVVELAGQNVAGALGQSGDVVVQTPPDPAAIADAVEQLLDDRQAAATMAGRARAFVEARTWDIAGERIDAALRRFLATPRTAEELATPAGDRRVAGHFLNPPR